MNSPELVLRNSEPRFITLLTQNESTLLAQPPLPETFYLDPTPNVARNLLGKGLLVRHPRGVFLGEIVETEAYLGFRDEASHSYRGPTPRSRPMFERGGICYVYLSYGLNFCMNVVTGEAGVGEAVLLRALTPIVGTFYMGANRGLACEPHPPRHLTNGPGKLTQALGIDLSFNGRRFDEPDFKLINLGIEYPSVAIGRSKRIGITKAASKLLRFYVKSSPWLSRKG